jgi:hypothetical protein
MALCDDGYVSHALRTALEEGNEQDDADSADDEPSCDDEADVDDGNDDGSAVDDDDDYDDDEAEMDEDEPRLLLSESKLDLETLLHSQRESVTDAQAVPQADAAGGQVDAIRSPPEEVSAAVKLDVTLDALEQSIGGRLQQLRIEDSDYWWRRFEWGHEDTIVQAVRQVRTIVLSRAWAEASLVLALCCSSAHSGEASYQAFLQDLQADYVRLGGQDPVSSLSKRRRVHPQPRTPFSIVCAQLDDLINLSSSLCVCQTRSETQVPTNEYGTIPDTVKIAQVFWRRADDLAAKPKLLFGFYEKHRTTPTTISSPHS